LFDLKPAEVMMVAAHEGDLQAAKALGLKTAYVHRPLEHGPGKATSMPAAGQFDYLAKDFKDLAAQLGASTKAGRHAGTFSRFVQKTARSRDADQPANLCRTSIAIACRPSRHRIFLPAARDRGENVTGRSRIRWPPSSSFAVISGSMSKRSAARSSRR